MICGTCQTYAFRKVNSERHGILQSAQSTGAVVCSSIHIFERLDLNESFTCTNSKN